MGFATKADMIEFFGEKEMRELTDRTVPRTGTIVDTVLDRALLSALGWIQTYLGESFDLKALMVDPPAPLVRVEADIARYQLYKNPTEAVANAFNNAIDYLKTARTGSLGLGANSKGETTARSDTAVFCSPGRVLTNARLSSYMNDTLPDECSP